MKHVVLPKPSLSEIFAAMKGVRCAGFENAALEDVAINAIHVSYDARHDLIKNSNIPQKNVNPEYKLNPPQEIQERAARSCLKFLNGVQDHLSEFETLRLHDSQYGAGGTVAELSEHIDQILLQEKLGTIRESVGINVSGVITPPFDASYLPHVAPKAKPKDKPVTVNTGIEIAPPTLSV